MAKFVSSRRRRCAMVRKRTLLLAIWPELLSGRKTTTHTSLSPPAASALPTDLRGPDRSTHHKHQQQRHGRQREEGAGDKQISKTL